MSALREIAESAEALAALLEARGEYYYETINEKRLVLGDGGRSGNCEYCVEASDEGWIPDDDVYEGPMGDEDGPPLHPHCFPGNTLVSACGVAAASVRVYEGELVRIRIAGVDDLSVTPNHPILTQRGWIAAGSLKISDSCVKCLSPSDFLSAIDPDDHYVESRIDEISSSLLMAGSMVSRGVPVSTEAFHGDRSADGKVDIVSSASAFARERSDFRQTVRHLLFRGGHTSGISLSRKSVEFQILSAARFPTHSIVRGSSPSGAALGRNRSVENQSRISSVSLLKADGDPSVSDSLTRYADAIGNRQDAFAGLVRFVQIEEINRSDFSGQVFNLQTQAGLYLAGTIVAHNCDCYLEYRERRHRVYA